MEHSYLQTRMMLTILSTVMAKLEQTWHRSVLKIKQCSYILDHDLQKTDQLVLGS